MKSLAYRKIHSLYSYRCRELVHGLASVAHPDNAMSTRRSTLVRVCAKSLGHCKVLGSHEIMDCYGWGVVRQQRGSAIQCKRVAQRPETDRATLTLPQECSMSTQEHRHLSKAQFRLGEQVIRLQKPVSAFKLTMHLAGPVHKLL